MHVNNEADGYRYMYYESQEGHVPLRSPGKIEHWNWQNGDFKINDYAKTYLIKSKIHILLESSLFTSETPFTFQKWPTADGFLGKYGIFWANVSSSTALALTNIDFLFSSADQFCVSRGKVIFFCVNGRFLQLKQTVEQPSIIVRPSVNSLLFLSSVGQHWGTWNFLN